MTVKITGSKSGQRSKNITVNMKGYHLVTSVYSCFKGTNQSQMQTGGFCFVLHCFILEYIVFLYLASL